MIKLINQQYGCFQSRLICNDCGKINTTHSFSWERNHFSTSDKPRIEEYIKTDMMSDEHICCIKCGNKLSFEMV